MNGELAFAIAVAAHGNAYLASPQSSRPPELVGTNSALKHVSLAEFRRGEDETPPQYAEDMISGAADIRYTRLLPRRGTSGWYLQLRNAAASRLRVTRLPIQSDLQDVYAASFAGGIPWGILVDHPGSFGLWFPTWEYDEKNRGWTVRVLGFAATTPPRQTTLELTTAAAALRAGIERALEFSTRARLEEFPGDFSRALALLDSPSPQIPQCPDLLPDRGYSLLARQATASAVQAYVFGGMGSFNDVGLQDLTLNAEYRALLPSLYAAIVDALLAAANSYGTG